MTEDFGDLTVGATRSREIVRIETFAVAPRWLFVRVETRDGAVGWGEASLEGHAEAVDGAFASLRDRFIGADAERIEDVWQIAYRGGFYRGGAVLMSALSGLDQALWDLKGRRFGVPVWQLLGGRVRDRVPVYAWIGGDRPNDVVEAAQARLAQGFKAVKMNATEEIGWLDGAHAFDAALERVAAVRALDMDVALDFHGRVHKPMAKQLAAALEPHRPLFIEEPLLSENIEGLIQLSRLTTLPIALGERLYSRWEYKPFFESGAVDVIQPDLSHAGGLSECRRIATMAEAYDVAVAPHCPLGPIALGACMQLALTTPNFVIQEMSLGIHYNVGHDLLSYMRNPEVFDVKDGMVEALAGAGLGVEINEELVREVAAQPHNWRNPIWRGADGSFREW
ncbi:galactonate dehydratase [Brevundimonas nasdae]|uniref:Galactonate dehydratase n=1 Tax=Brevundimonas nasdae TaxID=172043 RepID=A0ABX8THE9_9CAUL|nr:galactonate dehydratase [Brevundimonas nasdae]MBK6026899.1 galactonate dehydratase [Brevundimonas nasdae]MDQ0453572.1 galactonate dehydratase [Brevundimonas nasdae]QYC10658.1 galactonate dehydratase [Brevundimonas nasdae]QYC13445.1 galactonate dehydratase [Brevundimonas nasdae]